MRKKDREEREIERVKQRDINKEKQRQSKRERNYLSYVSKYNI